MSRYLALDIGRKHTGVAYADDVSSVPIPLETTEHADEHELVGAVAALVASRGIEVVILGKPLLLSGQETKQTRYTEHVGTLLRQALPHCRIEEVDERWTGGNHATAALKILTIFLERRTSRH